MFRGGLKVTKAISNVLGRDSTKKFSAGSWQRPELRKRGCYGDGLQVAIG